MTSSNGTSHTKSLRLHISNSITLRYTACEGQTEPVLRIVCRLGGPPIGFSVDMSIETYFLSNEQCPLQL